MVIFFFEFYGQKLIFLKLMVCFIIFPALNRSFLDMAKNITEFNELEVDFIL